MRAEIQKERFLHIVKLSLFVYGNLFQDKDNFI